jgi:hypothetical protein
MNGLRGKLESIASIALLLGTAGLLSACGSSSNVSSIVSNIQLSSYEQNGDLYAQVETQLSTQDFLITDLSLPIVDPNNPSIEYGSISLNNSICMPNTTCSGGGGELVIVVNLTEAAGLQSVSDLLPNGTAIPISGLTASDVLAFDVGGTGGKVYLDLTQGQEVVGVALPFSELNGVGAYVPGVDIFSPFTVNDVSGVVGIFAGAGSDQTGIALFADLSSVMASSGANAAAASAAGSGGAVAKAAVQSSAKSKLQMLQVTPSPFNELKLYNSLNELNKQGVELHLAH